MSGIDGTVAVTSRSAYMALSAGSISGVCAITATPTSSTCATNSAIDSDVRKPGIDSSLSRVPPVCPSPRPLILATGTPHAATSGATTSVIVSPTPPVECLSSTVRPSAERSTTSPERTIASVSATVSSASSPWMNAAISHAAIW